MARDMHLGERGNAPVAFFCLKYKDSSIETFRCFYFCCFYLDRDILYAFFCKVCPYMSLIEAPERGNCLPGGKSKDSNPRSQMDSNKRPSG